MKLRWEVSHVQTGRYRSFERRAWPKAYFANDDLAVSIECADEYVPRKVKTGEHAPLRVLIYDYSAGVQSRTIRRLKGEYATLAEAKARAVQFWEDHPELARATPTQEQPHD